MILRSPVENENGGIFVGPPSTRHSRARGNPALLRPVNLDTRVRGYDGTPAGRLILIPKTGIFKGEHKGHKNEFD